MATRIRAALKPRNFVDEKAFARNERGANHKPVEKVGNDLGYVVANHRKMVFAKSVMGGAIPSSPSSADIPWRWKFHTGESYQDGSTVTMVCVGVFAPSSNANATVAKWRCNFDDGTTTTSTGWGYADGTKSSPVLNDLFVQELRVDIDGDTAFEGQLEVEDLKVVSLLVYESHGRTITNSSLPAVNTYAQNQPIGTNVQGHYRRLHDVWKHNGTQLFSLVPEDYSNYWSTTSTSYVNMIDATASTTPAANTPGMNLSVQYHNPYHTTNVVCELWAYGSETGNGGDLILIDDNSSTLATLSSFSSSGAWVNASFNLDGSAALNKVDIQFKADNSQTLTIESVCAYVYVA